MKSILFILLFLSPCLFASPVLIDLNPDYPELGSLYSAVKVGDSSATGSSSSFKEGDETLLAAYAYLHPDSPHLNEAAYLERLKVLLAARFSKWRVATGDSLTEIAGGFQANYAYSLLKALRPQDITAAEKTAWESAIQRYATAALNNTLLYDQGIVANVWLNGDLRIAMGTYFAGHALNVPSWITRASNAINNVMNQTVTGDGATHYVGFHNEVATYRNDSILCLLWWWKITGSPSIKAMLDQTVPYVPLSVEPSGFQEQSTAIAYKHYYNGLRGRYAALATAYLYGDQYNYFYGKDVEQRYSPLAAPLLASLYRGPMAAKTPPSEFVVFDRAINGPRIRTAKWSCMATGRDPQKNPTSSPNQGYQGRMIGKNTFVGAMSLNPTGINNTGLDAAFGGICVEIKKKPGPMLDWTRDTTGVYRYLSQDENTSMIVRENFGTLATSYQLSTRTSSLATQTWGGALPWKGQQLWFLSKERLIGLVQISNDTAQEVLGLDTRIALVGGRSGIIGTFHDLINKPDGSYSFSNLDVRIGDNNFGGTISTQRFGARATTDDDYSAMIRLHDSADNNDDTPITYPANTRRWAIVECKHGDSPFADQALNVLPGNPNLAVLELREATQRFRIVQNLINQSRSYTGNFWAITGESATLHKSWEETIDDVSVPPGNSIPISITIPPYAHVIIAGGATAALHEADTLYVEDFFPDFKGAEHTAYLDWIYQNPVDETNYLPEADPDQDGYSNEQEFKCGTNPFERTVFSVTNVSTLEPPPSPNREILQFDVRVPENVSYVVEFSQDLSNWTDLEERTSNSAIETLQMEIPSTTSAFIRLRILCP